MTAVFSGSYQSTPDILAAKDRRVEKQEALCLTFNQTLVVLKLNIPGPIKDSPRLRAVLRAGVEAFKLALPRLPEAEELVWQAAGSEYYAVVPLPPEQVKVICVAIEMTHTLGRLMDFDVMTTKGGVGRSELGLPPRRCLICAEEAFVCGRSRQHSLDVLLERIALMIEQFEEETCQEKEGV